MQQIVITGVGVNCATGRSHSEFCDALHQGRPGISALEWIPVSRQNAIAAQLKNVPLSVPGRLRRIARQAIREALADAEVSSGLATKAGFYLATVAGDGLTAEQACERIASAQQTTRALRTALMTFPLGSLADRLARDFGLGGPRDVNTNACASGNIALGRALHAIRAGHVELAVVCGADQMKPITYYGADRSNILGPTIRPFHRDRNGTALGDGAGALVVESLTHARARKARIRAVIDGFGISCSEDPHEIVPQLDGRGVARCIRAALADANMPSHAVDYINAHATGTVNIEISECAGIRGAFGARAKAIPINATKSLTAHLSSASAVIEVIASIDALETGFLHETVGLDMPDPAFPLRFVAPGGEQRDIRTALSLSMGAGGVNTAVLLSSPNRLKYKRPASATVRKAKPVFLTAAAVVSDAPPRLAGSLSEPLPMSAAWTSSSELKRLSGGESQSHYNPAARLALAAATRLVECAGLYPAALSSERLALVVGTMFGGTPTWSEILARTYAENPRHITPSMALSHGAHLGATLISRRYGLIGPTVTLTGGITAGLSALGYARDLIQLGLIDRAIVCAMDIADAPMRHAVALLGAPSDAQLELHDAAVALLVESEPARRERNAGSSVMLMALEERCLPLSPGRIAPGLAEDALGAACSAAAASPILHIDGTANFHGLMPSLSEFRSGKDSVLGIGTRTSLARDFGCCGSAEALAAIVAGAIDCGARRSDTAIDIAVTGAGRGGQAACAILRLNPCNLIEGALRG